MLVLAHAGLGCGDSGECGPAAAPAAGVVATVGSEAITYGGFTSSPNNDCPPPEGGPISLTLDGTQSQPAPSLPFNITFCLPRPHMIGSEPIALDNPELVQVIDVNAELADGCILTMDRTTMPAGTIQFSGYCGDGLDGSGYAVELMGSVPGKRICAGLPDELVTIQLGGQVAVEALSQ